MTIDYGYELANGEIHWRSGDGWDKITDVPVENWLIKLIPTQDDEYINVNEKLEINHTFVDYGGYASIVDLIKQGWTWQITSHYMYIPVERLG